MEILQVSRPTLRAYVKQGALTQINYSSRKVRFDEAEAYLNHPVLGERLRTITAALLTHRDMSARDIFGGLDALKVRSCMTLFDAVSPDDIFAQVLEVFYHGATDKLTIEGLFS